MRDTSTEAAENQIAIFRRLSPAERVSLAFEASDWLMVVARARGSEVTDAPSLPGTRAIDALPTAGAPLSR